MEHYSQAALLRCYGGIGATGIRLFVIGHGYCWVIYAVVLRHDRRQEMRD